jgi:hypothetical protein
MKDIRNLLTTYAYNILGSYENAKECLEHLYYLNLLARDALNFSAIPPKYKGVGIFSVRTIE